jgi:hypothetical protein
MDSKVEAFATIIVTKSDLSRIMEKCVGGRKNIFNLQIITCAVPMGSVDYTELDLASEFLSSRLSLGPAHQH